MLQDRMANSSIGVHLEVADGADPPPARPAAGGTGAAATASGAHAVIKQPGGYQPWLGLG